MTRHLMRSRLRSFLPLLCLLALAVTAGARPSRASGSDDYPIDEVIVRLTPSGSLPALLARWDATVTDSIPSRRMYLLHLNSPVVQDTMTVELDGTADSRYCDYNFDNQSPEARRQIVVIAIGDSTLVRDQGAFARVHVAEAQALTRGAGSSVAILDTGVDSAHPLFAHRLLQGYDFVDTDSFPTDSANGLDDDGDGRIDEGTGHGTMVAGIIASIAPEAILVPVRVLDDEGRGTVFHILQGLYYAMDTGASVINLSLGMAGSSEAIEDAIEEAHNRDIFVTAAAGNDSSAVVEFPARGTKAFAVAATDSLDVKAPFSDWGVDVKLCAPGLGIYSAYRDGGYGQGAGTSFSAPFVSAAAALIRSRNPLADVHDVSNALENSALGIDGVLGNGAFAGLLGSGRLDILGALQQFAAPTGVRDPLGAQAVTAQLLGAQPAHESIALRLTPAHSGHLRFSLVDVRGRAALTREVDAVAGRASLIHIALRDDAGHPLATGVYVWRVEGALSHVGGRLVVAR